MSQLDEMEFAPHLSDESWDALLAAIDIVSDHVREDLDAMREDGLRVIDEIGSMFPRKYSARYDLEFVGRVSGAIENLKRRLKDVRSQDSYPSEVDQHGPLLSCLAEEIVMSYLIDTALSIGRDDWLGTGPLPAEKIYELKELHEACFQDRDFEILFHLELDGLEDDPRLSFMRFAHLRFEDWFRPFDDVSQ